MHIDKSKNTLINMTVKITYYYHNKYYHDYKYHNFRLV